MSSPMHHEVSQIAVLFFFATLFPFCYGEIGTAAQYRPPYLPTACYGNDASQFPSNNMFAAAGEGIWDNGAACGRQYLVRCITAAVPRACIPSEIIRVRIVDRAQSSVSQPSASAATIVLSTTSFASIANPSSTLVNVEYQQV